MKTKKQNAITSRLINILPIDKCKAVVKDHQNCVIAKAIKRQMKAEWVDVSASTVLVKRPHQNKVQRYLLDKTGREQVRFFDTRGMFAPCKLLLVAPPTPTGLRTGNKAKSGPSGKHNKTLATR